MPDAFGLFGMIQKLLKENEESLGVWFTPIQYLSGVALFVLLLGALIGLPFAVFSEPTHIVVVQLFALAAYSLLIWSLKLDVFDRFVYCSFGYVIVAAAPVLISIDFQLDSFLASHPDVVRPKVELFLYSLTRGMGVVAWALPLIVYLVIATPLEEQSGSAVVERARRWLLVLAFAAHGIATFFAMWWESILGRAFASLEGAGDLIDLIESAQMGYLVLTLAFLVTGFVSLAMAVLWARKDQARLVIVVAVGLVLTAGFYMFSKNYSRELKLYYPAARLQGIEAYRLKNSGAEQDGAIVFTHTFFDSIGGELGLWTPYSKCENRELGEFTHSVMKTDEFAEKFQGVRIDKLRKESPQRLFCREPDSPADNPLNQR